MELARLQSWYAAQCNGDWEHQYGVEIGTLDNPGWTLGIDLAETAWSDMTLERQVERRTETDWLVVEIAEGKFRASGGPKNLAEMIGRFFKLVVERAPS